MKIYLATWMLEVSQGKSLTKKQAKNRLLSYFHTREKTNEEIQTYVKTGQ